MDKMIIYATSKLSWHRSSIWSIKHLNEWMNEWLVGWLVDWLIDWLIDWFDLIDLTWLIWLDLTDLYKFTEFAFFVTEVSCMCILFQEMVLGITSLSALGWPGSILETILILYPSTVTIVYTEFMFIWLCVGSCKL